MAEPTQPSITVHSHRPLETTYQKLAAYSRACRGLRSDLDGPAEFRTVNLN
ncbi:MAG: hypothetical protein ACO31C_01035 [Schleiferiaceae bacterium]